MKENEHYNETRGTDVVYLCLRNSYTAFQNLTEIMNSGRVLWSTSGPPRGKKWLSIVSHNKKDSIGHLKVWNMLFCPRHWSVSRGMPSIYRTWKRAYSLRIESIWKKRLGPKTLPSRHGIHVHSRIVIYCLGADLHEVLSIRDIQYITYVRAKCV